MCLKDPDDVTFIELRLFHLMNDVRTYTIKLYPSLFPSDKPLIRRSADLLSKTFSTTNEYRVVGPCCTTNVGIILIDRLQ